MTLKKTILKQQVEVREVSGRDARVMEFRCMKCVLGGTVVMVACVTFAFRYPLCLEFGFFKVMNFQFWIFITKSIFHYVIVYG
jgi:hypothetical protein